MATVADRRYNYSVNEPNEIPPKQNYKWPWFVLTAVLLGFALGIVWMFFAVQKEKSEREFGPPPAAK